MTLYSIVDQIDQKDEQIADMIRISFKLKIAEIQLGWDIHANRSFTCSVSYAFLWLATFQGELWKKSIMHWMRTKRSMRNEETWKFANVFGESMVSLRTTFSAPLKWLPLSHCFWRNGDNGYFLKCIITMIPDNPFNDDSDQGALKKTLMKTGEGKKQVYHARRKAANLFIFLDKGSWNYLRNLIAKCRWESCLQKVWNAYKGENKQNPFSYFVYQEDGFYC